MEDGESYGFTALWSKMYGAMRKSLASIKIHLEEKLFVNVYKIKETSVDFNRFP
jgi:hypothetical protein